MVKESEKNKIKKEKKVKIKVRVNKESREKKEINKIKAAEELSRFKEGGASKEPLPNQGERIEQDKRLMMWAGVSFFMVLVLAFWVLNIKSIFQEAKDAGNNSSRFEWNKITNEFDQTMEQIKKGLEELKQMNITDNISTSTKNDINANNLLPGDKSIGSSSPTAGEPEEESLEKLKGRLKEFEKKLDNKN